MRSLIKGVFAVFGLMFLVVLCITVALSSSHSDGRTTPTRATDSPKSQASAWTVSKSVSKLDDSPTVILSLESSDTVHGWLSATNPELNVQCAERKVSIYFHPHVSAQPEYDRFEEVTVRYRVDAAPAKVILAKQATNGEALNLGGANLLRQLIKAKKLAVGFTPFNSNPATAEFDLTGLDLVMVPLRAACPSLQ